jgi:hypothetical protein
VAAPSNGRHCEERSDEAIQLSAVPHYGLLRFARNDGFRTSASHSQPSSPAKAGDPDFRDIPVYHERSGILDHPLSRVMTIVIAAK